MRKSTALNMLFPLDREIQEKVSLYRDFPRIVRSAFEKYPEVSHVYVIGGFPSIAYYSNREFESYSADLPESLAPMESIWISDRHQDFHSVPARAARRFGLPEISRWSPLMFFTYTSDPGAQRICNWRA